MGLRSHGHSAIDLAAVADTDDENDETVIEDAIDNAIIPDADPPCVIHARHLLDTMRARVSRERVNRRPDRSLNTTWQLAILAIGGGCKLDGVRHLRQPEFRL